MPSPGATPSDRAAAVLRAAEAAATAGRPATGAEPPPLAPSQGGAVDGLLHGADRLAGQVAEAKLRLQALMGALGRLGR